MLVDYSGSIADISFRMVFYNVARKFNKEEKEDIEEDKKIKRLRKKRKVPKTNKLAEQWSHYWNVCMQVQAN